MEPSRGQAFAVQADRLGAARVHISWGKANLFCQAKPVSLVNSHCTILQLKRAVKMWSDVPNLDFVAAVPPRSMNYNYSADVSSSTRVIFFRELHEKLKKKKVNLFVCF